MNPTPHPHRHPCRHQQLAVAPEAARSVRHSLGGCRTRAGSGRRHAARRVGRRRRQRGQRRTPAAAPAKARRQACAGCRSVPRAYRRTAHEIRRPLKGDWRSRRRTGPFPAFESSSRSPLHLRADTTAVPYRLSKSPTASSPKRTLSASHRRAHSCRPRRQSTRT